MVVVVRVTTADVADILQVVGVGVVDTAVIIVLRAGYLSGHRCCPCAGYDEVWLMEFMLVCHGLMEAWGKQH